MLSWQQLYEAYDTAHRPPEPERQRLSAMDRFCKRERACVGMTAFDRINQCRKGLEALDRQGWQRSFHQRQFHEEFLRACARIFYKTSPPGAFQRDHQRLLQANGWKNLSQEILISTPRRCKSCHLFSQSPADRLVCSWENDFGEPVRRRHPLQRPPHRAEYLQHMQAHQSKVTAQRQEIPRPHLP